MWTSGEKHRSIKQGTLKYIYFLAKDFLQQMFKTARRVQVLIPSSKQNSSQCSSPSSNQWQTSTELQTLIPLTEHNNSCSGNSYVFAIIITQMGTETPVLRPVRRHVKVWSPARHLGSGIGQITVIYFSMSKMKLCILLWTIPHWSLSSQSHNPHWLLQS